MTWSVCLAHFFCLVMNEIEKQERNQPIARAWLGNDSTNIFETRNLSLLHIIITIVDVQECVDVSEKSTERFSTAQVLLTGHKTKQSDIHCKPA